MAQFYSTRPNTQGLTLPLNGAELPKAAAWAATGSIGLVAYATGAPDQIVLARMTADGAYEGVPYTIPGPATAPQILALSGGGWAVAWTDPANSESFVQLFAADGTLSGSTIALGAGPEPETAPRLFAGDGGSFWAVYDKGGADPDAVAVTLTLGGAGSVGTAESKGMIVSGLSDGSVVTIFDRGGQIQFQRMAGGAVTDSWSVAGSAQAAVAFGGGLAVAYVAEGAITIRTYTPTGELLENYGLQSPNGLAPQDVELFVNPAGQLLLTFNTETTGFHAVMGEDLTPSFLEVMYAYDAVSQTEDGRLVLVRNSPGAGGKSDVVLDVFYPTLVDDSATGVVTGGALGENLSGLEGDDVLFGGGGDDYLVGDYGPLSFADVLNGGTGADVMVGGNGDDTYVVDDAGDVTTEAANGGFDTVYASVDLELADHVERAYLTVGGKQLIGNDLDNVLGGSQGADTLIGGGGVDFMQGWTGDDNYVVDDWNDAVVEAAGEGTDTVMALVDYKLGANVENLFAGAAGVRLWGNDLNNLMVGLSGGEHFDGGAGADTMIGGAGDDFYHVDNFADVVVESAGEGYDTVIASTDVVLAANVERVWLTRGAEALGNDLDNVMGGSSGDDVLNGGVGIDFMQGGAGDDSYYVDQWADAVSEAVGEGIDTVYASVSYALSAEVENLVATGGADVSLYGNSLVNQITGNDGANILDGGLGADVLTGGAGDDVYFVQGIADQVVETAEGGYDTVVASGNYQLADNVERGWLASAGVLGGNALNNVLGGSAGNDELNGGLGQDLMEGGDGDDTYYVENWFDDVREASGQGFDVVMTNGDYALKAGAEIELLWAVGSGDIALYGNAFNTEFLGNDDDNFIDGGAGGDVMSGGKGDDWYVIDNGFDATFENAGDGFDTVTVGIDGHVMYANVERAFLQGFGLSIVGNAQDNVIVGTDGDDTISGAAGNDLTIGGLGDDTYGINDWGDVVVEGVGEGVDKAVTVSNWKASDNVENIEIAFAGISVWGNDLNNTIQGSTGAEYLDGGAGADTLIGGAGDDVFVVDDAGDSVVEQFNGGYDTISTSISYTLSSEVERGWLTAGGQTLTGNNLDNVLGGSSGDDVLVGRAGRDFLEGGAGADIFRYFATGDSNGFAGRDVIADFQTGVDKIDVSAVRIGGSDTFVFEDRGGGLWFLNVDLGGDGSIDLSVRVNSASVANSDVIWDAPPNAAPPPIEDVMVGPQQPAEPGDPVEDVFVFTPEPVSISDVAIFQPAHEVEQADAWSETVEWSVGFDALNGWITIDDSASGRPDRGLFWN